MKIATVATAILLAVPAAAQAQVGGWDPAEVDKARATSTAFLEASPSMERFFKEAYAYAVYPTIAKAAFIVGGAHGSGIAFRNGSAIGKTSLTQASVGLQWGGQAYSEIIFFQNEASFERFASNNLELAAQVSAVVVTAGASADVAYEGGVAVFTMAKGGAMLEASVGGQKLKFEPREEG